VTSFLAAVAFARSDGRSRAAASAAGARIIYYHLISRDQFYMLLIYGKNEQDDLSPEQLRMLKKAVEAIWQ
jgi:hypothetical protein